MTLAKYSISLGLPFVICKKEVTVSTCLKVDLKISQSTYKYSGIAWYGQKFGLP